MGWKRIKTRRKMGFWDRNGEVLRLIKKLMMEMPQLNIVKSNIISLFSIDNRVGSRAEKWHFRFIFAVFVFFLTFVYRTMYI
jgi:hypothetical protein